MPELRQLRAFLAVAEELNFTRAAERLNLGQQAVSKSVGQLERELGVSLLERTSHWVRLTPAGEELLRDGHVALADVEAAFARARDVGLGTAGTLRAGVSPALGPTERDALVRALRHGAPGLSVTLHEVWPQNAVTAMRSRDVELVVARTAPADAGVDAVALDATPARLYVPADHRLAQERAPVELAALDGERLLTWNVPGTPLTDYLMSRLAAAGATVHPVQARVSGMAVSPLSDLVALGAVALGPPEWPEDPSIAEVPLAAIVDLPLLVLWPTGAESAAVRRVREAMRAA